MTSIFAELCAYDEPIQRFTGKERAEWAESGLDYFGARYFSGAQGRFTSPDEPLADQDLASPQSWNLYSYVRNNPLRFTDPTGRACVVDPNGNEHDDNSGGQSCADAHSDPVGGKITVTGQGAAYTDLGGVFYGIDSSGGRYLIGERPLQDDTLNLVTNVLPLAKGALIAGVLAGSAGASLIERIAVALGGRIVGGGEQVVIELANGALVTLGAQTAAGNLTVNISGVAAFGTTGNLFAIRQSLLAVARAEGAESVTVVAEKVGNPALADALVKQGFKEAGSATTFNGQAVQTFAKTYGLR